MEPTIILVEDTQDPMVHAWLTSANLGRVVCVKPAELDEALAKGAHAVLIGPDVPVAAELGEVLQTKNWGVPVAVFFLNRRTLNEVAAFTLLLARILEPPPEAPAPEEEGREEEVEVKSDWESISLDAIAGGMLVSRRTLAHILGTTERNLVRWRQGKTRPRGIRDANVQQLRRIYALLTMAFKPEAIPRYLRDAVPSLGVRVPLQLLLAGEFSAVGRDLARRIRRRREPADLPPSS